MRPEVRNARLLRKNQTETEKALWDKIRKRRLGGFRFTRQMPVGPYVLDFVCRQEKLVVELDGSPHEFNREEDERREGFLASRGFEVLRFWNQEVFDDIDLVLKAILVRLQARNLERLSRSERGE